MLEDLALHREKLEAVHDPCNVGAAPACRVRESCFSLLIEAVPVQGVINQYTRRISSSMPYCDRMRDAVFGPAFPHSALSMQILLRFEQCAVFEDDVYDKQT